MSTFFEAPSRAEARLIGILEAYMAALEAGEAPSREALLAKHPDLADRLGTALAGLDFVRRGAKPPAPPPDPAQDPASLLGDFRLIREAGRGGMGVVYEAEQISLRRRVALKVLPFAAVLDERQLQRFRLEAQSAALLHHTHIVPVYAVGQERGVHYYAMQYIDGQSLQGLIRELRARETGGTDPSSSSAALNAITKGRSSRSRGYCEAVARLGIDTAQALDHAHEHGVIHRDIKPANLLVDARGHVWVTDFGLARSTNDAGLTMTGDLVGTVRYMSPEQTLAKRVPVDHRTDVYSLGATLYEALTLEPVFPGEDAHQVIHDIAFREPVGLRRVNPAIPPQLETIMLKALRKDPGARYDTAAELAEDLQRFLADQPIRARRPSLAERAQSWARRHRALAGAAIGLLLLTTAGLAVGAALVARERNLAEDRLRDAEQERKDAKRQAAIAEAVSAFLNDDLLAAIDPDEMGPGVTLREVLDAASARIEEKFPDEPLVEARLRSTIGNAYQSLGLYEEAERHLARALELLDRAVGAEDARTLRAKYDLGSTLHDLDRETEAEALLREAVEGQRRVLGELHRDTLRSRRKVAVTLRDGSDPVEAERLLHEILDTQRRVLGEEDPQTLTTMNSLAIALRRQGKYADAEALYRETLEIRRRVLGEGNRRTLTSMHNLANALSNQAEYAEAEELLRRAVEGRTDLLGAEHPDTLASVMALGEALCDQGEHEDAEGFYRRAFETWRRVSGEEDPKTLAAMSALAGVLRDQGKLDDAEALYRELSELRKRGLGTEDPGAMSDLAGTLLEQGEAAEAEAIYRDVLEIQRRAGKADHQDTLLAMSNLGGALLEQGKLADAEALFRETLDAHKRVLGEAHSETLRTATNYAATLLSLRKAAEAEKLLRETLPVQVRALHEEHPEVLSTSGNIAVALQAQGKLVEAAALLRKNLEIERRVLREGHEDTLKTMGNLALVLRQQGRNADAEPLLSELLAIQRRLLGEEDGKTRSTMRSLVLVLAVQGKAAEADVLLELLVSKGGKKTAALCNQLGWLHATAADPKLRDPARALRLAKTALDLAPEEGNSWNTLGVAQYRAGDWRAALAALEKSMELRSGGDAHDWLFLAMARWQLGEKGEARKWYDRGAVWTREHGAADPELARFQAEAADLLGLTATPR